ncbi:two pore domain potassium channel family protein [Candidatus Micrarchaeota archaeon]|nr:two pore domain potassium channel family protein [Candidatus Micrarchaeota archaeon]
MPNNERVEEIREYVTEEPYTQRRIFYSVAVIVILLFGGAVVFHSLEKWTWIDSFYFATVSLTTVGYGDIVPQHEITRLFLIFYLLFGVATVLYALSNVARYYLEKRERQFERNIRRVVTLGSKMSTLGEKVSRIRIPHPPTMRGHGGKK